MAYSKDIKLKSGASVYYFKFLPWDTEFFGKDSFMLDTGRSKMKPSFEIKKMIEKRLKDSFVTAKIESGEDKGVIDFLQSAGFKYVDVEVVLKYAGPENRPKAPAGLSIEEAKKNAGLPYADLGSSFDCTRFHCDKNIAKEKADSLWVSFIRTYAPSTSRYMFIAKLDKRVVGAILAHKEKDLKRIQLSFVAVLKEFRGRSVGAYLIQAAIDHFKGFEIVTETQAKNIRALNFYIKNGFSMIEKTKTVMHRWRS